MNVIRIKPAEAAGDRVNRRTHYRGQHVTVTFRNNKPPITGRIDGWGVQIIAIRPDEATAGHPDWKVVSFSVHEVDEVTQA